MKISIALCTYNGEKFLAEQLAGFLAQSRLPDEVVICDDCSQDGTIDIIRDFAANAPFPVRWFVNDSNRGYIKNFERAIRLCEGDIIFLSDQDDVWLGEKIDKFVSVFAEDKSVGLVFCNGELVDKNLNSLNKSAWEARLFDKEKQKRMKKGEGWARLLSHNVASGCMMAFRSEYRNLLLPIPNDIPGVPHDHWIIILMLAASKVEPLPEKLVMYRQHDSQQISMTKYGELSDSFYLGASKKYNFAANQITFEGLKKHLSQRFEKQSKNHRINHEKLLNELDEQIQHSRARAAIAESRRRRIRRIIKELSSLRYHRYSNGWRSAAKDLSLYILK